MRAILVDPETVAITDIVIKGDGIEEIRDLIGCRSFASGARPLRGNMETGFDHLLVSDDYMDERSDARFWFQVDADKNPPSSHPIAGRGLITGVDTQGETCDAVIALEDLVPRITFSRRKFRGFRVRDGRGDIEVNGVAMYEPFVVEMDAPLIDGMNE